MASWFSRPFDWGKDKDKDGGMTFAAGTDNSLTLTRKTGPIELRAFYDGLVVYRQKSTSPDTGNLELALFPDKWPIALQKHFNPDSAGKPVRSGFTELPPGRFVYQNIPRAKIEERLHKIMLDSFLDWRTSHGVPHPSIQFIEGTNNEYHTLKELLEELWNKTPGDETKKKEAVATEITRILDLVFKQSADNPLGRALPVLADDLLATLGDDRTPISITFEIRNLYGEPLNPHFYLRKLERTAGELAPSPPFQSTDNFKEARLKDDPTKFLAIRIPKNGGAEFDLMPDPGRIFYKSPLIWTHTFTDSSGTHSTVLAARPGETPTKIPAIDPKEQTGVNVIWDNDNALINKYAEMFSCPCELIVATIRKEARPGSDNKGDLHSIRFEKIDKTVDVFALDYEDLKEEAKKSDSPLTDIAADAYWRLAGGWRTDPDSPAYEVSEQPANSPKFEPAFPVSPDDNLGTSALTSQIDWKQIEAIATLKPQLITRREMLLPPLGKKDAKSKTHYQLIVESTDLGTAAEAADVALVYYKTVGGIGLVDGKEVLLKLAARKLTNYPLPFDKNKDVEALRDGTKIVKWRQLLVVLNILRSNGLPKAPQPAYVLNKLQTKRDFDYESRYIVPKLADLLGRTEDQARLVLDKYSKLASATKGLLFTTEGTPPVPLVKAEFESSITATVTLEETQEISKVVPGRISVGVGQVLFDTAARRIITWVRLHFGNKFFTDLGLEAPPGDVPSQIPWLWTNLWSNRELQIAFIAAYHKQNATVFWQALSGKNDYRIGERMTMFDFPRQGACYNAGSIRKTEPGKDDTDWGLVTFGAYQTKYWSAIDFAIKKFDLPASPKAKVRLRPDLEPNSGMDAR